MNDSAGSPAPTEAPSLSRQTWISASALLIACGLTSKMLGFLREILIARNFGAGASVDAFQVAYSLPALLGGALGSALGTAVVPVYHRVLAAEGPRGASRMAGGLVLAALIAGILLGVLPVLFPDFLVRLLAPSVNEGTRALAVQMTQRLPVLLVAMILVYLLPGIFNATHHFKIPALSDLLSHLFTLAALVFLASRLEIYALVWGTVAGALFVACFQVGVLLAKRTATLNLDLGTPPLRSLYVLTAPILLGDLFMQLTPLVLNFFASGLPQGSIASMGYATRLCGAVLSLLAVSVARGAFPTLSALATQGRKDEAQALFVKLNRHFMFAFVPMAVFCAVFSGEIIRAVFMRGAFDAAALASTSTAFGVLVGGIPVSVIFPLYLRACYAFADMSTPLWSAAVGLVSLIGLNGVLAPRLGIAGLALSSVLSVVPALVVLGVSLRRSLGGLQLLALARSVLISAACAAAAVAPFHIFRSPGLTYLAAAGLGFGALYLGFSWLFSRKDVRILWRWVTNTSGRGEIP